MKTFKTKVGTELPILDLRGKDYLQVAHRLVWFREEHPDWCIETILVGHSPEFCIARAEIRDEKGHLKSTAHKREDVAHFHDAIEKAETGAIGRALALVGFGTQFTADELEEGDRLADAPLPPKVAPRSIVSVNKAIDIRPPHDQPSPLDSHMLESDRLHAEAESVFGSLGDELLEKTCELCGADLQRTKKNDAYNCPNWKDKSKGSHTYIKD